MLPTLLLFCTVPQGTEGSSYHLRITTAAGFALVLRDALQFKSWGGGSTSAEGARDLEAPGGPDWSDYHKLGIGGLKSQLEELFRRAFSSRMTRNHAIAAKIGLRHVRGVILHGPPGTGKTLIARKVAKMLRAKTVQLISGPEIMSKFVGESEKNLRGLFAPAELDAEKNPDDLHVIIMDEIDAVLRPRGAGDDSGARAVYDGVTTQMLAYMDGLKALNNILVIGTTNRLNSIDKALLRPGRFEVQIRIPLPDDNGRREIFEIHTKKLADLNMLAPSVELNLLARRTAALSGADIEGIVRSAVSYGFVRHEADAARHIATAATTATPTFSVELTDFERGVQEILSTKGSQVNTAPFLDRGVVIFNSRIRGTIRRLADITSEMRSSNALRRMRMVLEGPHEAGTTAIAALAARNSRFAYVNVITPESFVGLGVAQRIELLASAFDEAANVAHACIVLDRVDRLIDYSVQQGRSASPVAQELSVLLDRNPALVPFQQDSRLLVILTTSVPEALRELTPSAGYDAREYVYPLTRSDIAVVLDAYSVFESEADAMKAALQVPAPIGIKKLLLLIDAARSKHGVAGSRVPLKLDAASFSVAEGVPPEPPRETTQRPPEGTPALPRQYLSVSDFVSTIESLGLSFHDPPSGVLQAATFDL